MQKSAYSKMYDVEDKHFWFLGKRAFAKKLIDQLKLQSPQILDIGCGTGGTTKFLSQWGGQVVGIEQNISAASFASKRGIKVFTTSANRLPFANNSFDLVTIFDVLYHKGVEETKVLKEAYRVLKPNGAILIIDCAHPWLWSHHDTIMQAKYRYTKGQLTAFISSTGFRISALGYIFVTLFPFFAITRLLKKIFTHSNAIKIPPKHINNFLARILFFEASLYPRLNALPGSSIMVLAYKS